MPSIRTALLAAALPLLVHAAAHAQGSPPPRKRLDVITQGMTPAQVRALLGEPIRTSRDGRLTYLYYANGCVGCADDYVVVRDCRVVGARFDNPNRYVARADSMDATAPPPAECALAAAEPARPPVRLPDPLPADSLRHAPAGPRDLNPGGAPPAERRPLVAPDGPTAPGAPEAPAAALPQQDPRAWRAQLTLRRPVTHLVAVPAASISSPTAFGSQQGEAFVGAAYQARTRFTHLSDGAFVLGFGLGDRQRYVGLEVAATSYSTLRGGGPLQTGGLSFKLHRALSETWGAAVGYENALDWGGSDAGHSPYAVVTHIFRLKPDATQPVSALAATLGVGAGRFRTERDVVANRKTANVFGAVGLQVFEPVSVTADWNGQDLFAGVSVAPARRIPFVVTAGFADITRNAGDGPRFIVSAALGFRYLPPFFF
ncbi:MAG TPA: hypothetical protein VGO40_13375 [Longimicrobium sp.]|jgi:hypothetical protein|nr:hypothetical protein [Longimicrobium sp.]